MLRDELETAIFNLERDDKIALLMSALLHDRNGMAEATYSLIASGCSIAEQFVGDDYAVYFMIKRLRAAADRLDARPASTMH